MVHYFKDSFQKIRFWHCSPMGWRTTSRTFVKHFLNKKTFLKFSPAGAPPQGHVKQKKFLNSKTIFFPIGCGAPPYYSKTFFCLTIAIFYLKAICFLHCRVKQKMFKTCFWIVRKYVSPLAGASIQLRRKKQNDRSSMRVCHVTLEQLKIYRFFDAEDQIENI